MHPIQIGISTNIFGDPAEMSTLIRRLSKAFSVIEIVLEHSTRRLFDERRSLWATQRRELLELRQMRGLTYCMHAPYVGPYTDLAHLDKRVRRASVAYLSRCLDEAFLLGVRLVTLHPGAVNVCATNTAHAQIDTLVRSLEILKLHATTLDIELSLGNPKAFQPSNLALSEPQKRFIYEEIGIGSTLDILDVGALDPCFDEYAYWETLVHSLPYVSHVHFTDLRDTHLLQLLLGRRDFAYIHFVTALREFGYTGHLVIEEGRTEVPPPRVPNEGRRRPSKRLMEAI